MAIVSSSTATHWFGPQFSVSPPAAADWLLGAVVLQDVRVLLPELVCDDVAVVVLHPPPAAGHRHVFLLLIW